MRRGRRTRRIDGIRRSGARRFLWRTLLAGGVVLALAAGGRTVLRLTPPGAASADTALLEEGTVTVTVQAEGLVVRRETVVRAPSGGTVQRLVAEGERVRAGTPVVALSPGPLEVTAPCSGIVVYQVDGLEGSFVPEAAVRGRPSLLSELPAPETVVTASGEVEEGAPLFKVVDNLSMGVALTVPASKAALLHDGDLVSLQVGEESLQRSGRVQVGSREGDEVLLYLIHLGWSDDLVLRRRVRVFLVLAEYTGKIVPRSAVDVQDGQQGVWILRRGEPTFYPVRVVGGSESEAVVETDLPRGTRVLRSPPRAS